METQLNLIAEQEPWKNLSKKYFGIHSYLKEAISKTIMFDIQPELFLDDNNIDSVVMYLLNNHQRDLLAAMKNVSTSFFSEKFSQKILLKLSINQKHRTFSQTCCPITTMLINHT